MTVTEFYHYGMPKRSGRYPYGSGERPYQSSGGKIGFFQKRKIQKQEKEKLEKARTAARREKEIQKLLADKERVLKEGSATELLRYQGLLTNTELRKAIDRLDLEKKVRDFSDKEMKSRMDKMDEIMMKVKTGTKWVGICTDLYNSVAYIYNSTEKGKEKPLSIVQTKMDNQNKDNQNKDNQKKKK